MNIGMKSKEAAPAKPTSPVVNSILRLTIIRSLHTRTTSHRITTITLLVPACDLSEIVRAAFCTTEEYSSSMDDPDVDLELIALLRERLGVSNKAQDTVSNDTGKSI